MGILPSTNWTKLFHAPMRCQVPTNGDSIIQCDPFFAKADGPIFDYPTFNPLYKMNSNYQFFYAIAAKSPSSRWFDQLTKVDVKTRMVSKQWSSAGIYLTEADYIPRSVQMSDEADAGLLVSVLYN